MRPRAATTAVLALAATLALLSSAAVSAAPDGSGDPLRDEQYGLEMTGLGQARADGVTVAVVDTGVDPDHPDLAGSLVPGIDLVDNDRQPDDPNGHGTHIAGIIAANTGNGVGIAGAAPGSKIMPVRVLDENGQGSPAVAARGVRWAVEQGANVINLSVGTTNPVALAIGQGGPLASAIVQAVARNVTVVAAAGNAGVEAKSFRVGVPLLVVSAVGPHGELAEFSNYGDAREVAAPGVGIMSTVPAEPTELFGQGTDGYAELDGSSFAAPFASALAAVLVSRRAAPRDVSEIIEGTAVNPERLPRLGAGLINAGTATEWLPDPGPVPERIVPDSGPSWLVIGGVAALGVVVLVALRRALAARRG